MKITELVLFLTIIIADYNGGALYASGTNSSVITTGGSFLNNTANYRNGGALYMPVVQIVQLV